MVARGRSGVRRPWIKVCGITRREDALSAVGLGADAVGFILARESPRRIDAALAAAIARELPSRVARVGVVVSLPAEGALELVETIGLTALQAHGDESPETCLAYGVPVVKAIPTGPGFRVSDLEPYAAFPILLDGYSPNARGGTGLRADWTLARDARESGYRVLLAGGLGPANVRDAVETVSPLGVDLNSGVERAPGVKDPLLVRRAIEALAEMDPPEEATWPW